MAEQQPAGHRVTVRYPTDSYLTLKQRRARKAADQYPRKGRGHLLFRTVMSAKSGESSDLPRTGLSRRSHHTSGEGENGSCSKDVAQPVLAIRVLFR